eukprot:1583938-Amphidinium_carterae.1
MLQSGDTRPTSNRFLYAPPAGANEVQVSSALSQNGYGIQRANQTDKKNSRLCKETMDGRR